MNSKNKIGFISKGVFAPNLARHYMTYSPREGEKVNIVPGDVVPANVAAVENKVYWELKLKKLGILR